MPTHTAEPSPDKNLVRGVGLGSATALNMIDMIGVGPFITIPLIVGAMGGPQAMLGWVLGAAFAMCDGMIWAELGAAMPASGGSYGYLREIYGGQKWGRLLSFLFIWQLSFSAPLSIASGCIGLSQYAAYIWPSVGRTFFARDMQVMIPFLGPFELRIVVTVATLVAIGTCLLAVLLLYRRITTVGAFSKLLWVGVIGTIVWIIASGLAHFDSKLAFDFPPHAFTPGYEFFTGLGAAMLIATYDYWGYYNVCFFAGEVKDPARNIPRALLISIVAVASIYIVMNISILGVLPWRELDQAAKADQRFYVVATFMQRIHGAWAGTLVSVLIMWTAFASVFSLLLGYSRVPYAAARDGNYFKVFAKVHPTGHFPHISLLALGGVAAAFCFLRLADVIAALVVIRIMIQFLVQAVGVMVLRKRRPDMPRPYRMWLYPLPALLAIVGFLYVMISRKNFLREVRYGLAIIVVGVIVYLIRSYKRREWPFEVTDESAIIAASER
ncbi:MAG TPA: APC family permease [Clostridia bacterium]|nr:APC family permease [Clostridia bacterium]